VNRKERRSDGTFEEPPWWKWAGVHRIIGTRRPSRKERLETLRAASIAAGVAALALILMFGLIWLVQHV
jgi:hypothetical protein